MIDGPAFAWGKLICIAEEGMRDLKLRRQFLSLEPVV